MRANTFHSIVLIMTCISRFYTGYAQGPAKPALRIEDLDNQPAVQASGTGINASGEFVFYTVNDPLQNKSRCTLQSLHSDWKRVFDQAKMPAFSRNGDYFFSLLPEKQLVIVNLKKRDSIIIKDVNQYKNFSKGSEEYLVYILGKEQRVVCKNLSANTSIVYEHCQQFDLSPDNTRFLFRKPGSAPAVSTMTLAAVGQKEGKEIWTGHLSGNPVFNRDAKLLGFISEEKEPASELHKLVWIYNIQEGFTVTIPEEELVGPGGHFRLTGVQDFSVGGRNLVFTFEERKIKDPAIKTSLELHSYTDTINYSLQKSRFLRTSLLGILNIDLKRVIYKESAGEFSSQPFTTFFKGVNDSIAFVRSSDRAFFMSTKTGKKIIIDSRYKLFHSAAMSPDGRYCLLNLDAEPRDTESLLSNNVFSYDVRTGKIENLTGHLPIPVMDTDFSAKNQRSFNFQGWTGSGNVLIKDHYDIWQLDPSNISKPINLTNGFGRRNKITFSLSKANFIDQSGMPVYWNKPERQFILISYDYTTCQNDFYSLRTEKTSDPIRLSSGGFLNEAISLSIVGSNVGSNGFTYLSRASNTHTVLLGRQSASASFNLFVTKDFVSYKDISQNYPEQRFNGITSELLSFKNFDGKMVKAVLYKPENFDSTKKYPLIFDIYQGKTQELYLNKKAELSGGHLPIAYMVSNGYLVCAPDVNADYGKGMAGQYVCNTVLSAVDYLSQKSWIDSARTGVIGGSWGGFETNYIITHTHRFKAIITCCGHSDPIANQGEPTHANSNLNFGRISYDYVQGGIYDNISIYIDNSPKLLANKVMTPFLLIHNDKDDGVPFNQGLTFFNALWQLGKVAWLLNYTGEGHGNRDKDNQIDVTIRIRQFFDHYLKNTPPPEWMTKGIPYRYKDTTTGLGPDSSGDALLPLPARSTNL